jgi:DNA-binding Xre family transcriptional regulator
MIELEFVDRIGFFLNQSEITCIMRHVEDMNAVIAANVRAERTRRGWRQKDLGDRLSWSLSQVCDLENRKRAVRASELPLLCWALDMALRDLLAGADPGDLTALGILPAAAVPVSDSSE